MKRTLLIYVLVFLVQSAPAQAQKRTLVDFRVDRASAPLRIPAATQKSVLSKVFRRYLTDEKQCNSNFDAGNSNDLLEAARKAGEIVPSIIDMAEGSFTSAGQTQTAYVISVSECFASHADNFGSKRVAVFNGNQLVADMDIDFKSDVLRKTDLNADGIDELLMSSGYMNQGILVRSAALLTFQDGRFKVIEDLGQVSEDSCASGMPGSGVTASVISVNSVEPGKIPNLKIDNYAASCCKPRRWRFISTGKTPV